MLFLKSTKGGEGFRKFEIIRNNQNIPFSVKSVHGVSNVKLFTIPTIAVKFFKGEKMEYPMNNYVLFTQIGKKSKIDTHWNWEQVRSILTKDEYSAQPVDPSDIQSSWLTLKDMTFANKVLNMKKPRYYKGRKGIEPAGAKGVYILKEPQKIREGYLKIENDISRQRRQDIIDKGINTGIVEETYIFPMLGGRNISKWKIKSNEFMIVPHSIDYKYGIPEKMLALESPETYSWLSFYEKELLETRIQNGKFFNKETNPFYRLDNVGDYTYCPYKVLWKEQTGSMSAVVAGSYYKSVPNPNHNIFTHDKIIVVDSKVLMLGLYNEMEAYFVCGIINSPNITSVIDGYSISTNRGVDVLKYIAIPKFNEKNELHQQIAHLSKAIHNLAKENQRYTLEEQKLNELVMNLFADEE